MNTKNVDEQGKKIMLSDLSNLGLQKNMKIKVSSDFTFQCILYNEVLITTMTS